MPKHAASMVKTGIVLDRTSSISLHRQLYDRLRMAILSGQLKAGTRLSSTRALASQLGISRNTVSSAYEQLLAEGYVDSKVGNGTSVAPLLPEALLNVPADLHAPQLSQDNPAHSTLSQRGATLARAPYMPGPLSAKQQAFQGLPILNDFPHEIWAQIIARRVRHSFPDLFTYQESAGYRPLREAIASYLGVARGVRCTAEQVIVVAGSQGGLDLAARVLLDPGDATWIEDPGYLGARGALLGAGAHLVPVPVDEEGLNVAAGMILSPEARLAFVTPSHQFPLGVTMSLARRLALLEWANQANAWILEDDYDSEFRFSGRPLAALQGLDRTQRVIYLGTFSKVLFPALRLGYLVVPLDVVDAFVAARRFMDVHVSALEQAALADFMNEGHFTRHIRRMRTLYAGQRATLVEALTHELGDIIEVHSPEAGMQLVAWLPPDVDDKLAAQRAAAHGVHVLPVSFFSIKPMQRGGLLLGYTALDEKEICDGVRRLAIALHSF